MRAKIAHRRRRAPRGEGERLRDEILAATERLLVATGDVDGVSIRAIADAVGVTPPSIYLHFADKDALVNAVCERHFRELDRVSAEATEGITDPVAALRAMGTAYVRFGVEHPEEYRILFMSRHTDAPSAAYLERLKGLSGFEHLVAAVQRCMDAGTFAAGDAFAVACTLWAAVHGITSLLIAKPNFPWPTNFVDRGIESLCRGFASEVSR
jgi:AcrR family transcriptional regulator